MSPESHAAVQSAGAAQLNSVRDSAARSSSGSVPLRTASTARPDWPEKASAIASDPRLDVAARAP